MPFDSTLLRLYAQRRYPGIRGDVAIMFYERDRMDAGPGSLAKRSPHGRILSNHKYIYQHRGVAEYEIRRGWNDFQIMEGDDERPGLSVTSTFSVRVVRGAQYAVIVRANLRELMDPILRRDVAMRLRAERRKFSLYVKEQMKLAIDS